MEEGASHKKHTFSDHMKIDYRHGFEGCVRFAYIGVRIVYSVGSLLLYETRIHFINTITATY